ncbi:MAG: hypothetical protein OTJ97_02055 [SAR202 cluster bacterium]|nr:hypothetical protein [SAR202 cluster bacterium]
MTGRTYLINVGANASHRFAGPIFSDGTFEFLPISEDRDLPAGDGVRYHNLRSFYDLGQDLMRYVPPRLRDRTAHADPEWDTFTYGDNCATSPRAAALKRVVPGDRLLFLVRLQSWDQIGLTEAYGFYLVGFIHVDGMLRNVTARPDDAVLDRFGRNSHVWRGLSGPGLWNGFCAFSGSSQSRRLSRAAPLDRSLANRFLPSADGSPWRWDAGGSDLQVIGSYTRSYHCVIDPALPGHSERSDILWEWVMRHE